MDHLDAYLGCKQCSRKFKSVQEFREHEHNTPSNRKGQNEFNAAINWVKKFLNQFDRETEEDDFIVGNCLGFQFCPVCSILNNFSHFKSNKVFGESNQSEDVSSDNTKFDIVSHIHHHLQYFPFECFDCMYASDSKIKFCLDEKARQHLINSHGADESTTSVNELRDFFGNEKGKIRRLDELVNSSLNVNMAVMKYWDSND